jgi:hypothetical protein
MNFDEEFYKLLGDRTQIEEVLKSLSKFNEENIKLEITRMISYDDTDWENVIGQPGYTVCINPTDIDDYQYKLFNVLLPNKDSFPLSVKFYSMNGKHKYMFADLKSFDDYVNNIVKSNDYIAIIKAIKKTQEVNKKSKKTKESELNNKKKIRIKNYTDGYGIQVFKVLRDCTDYEFNHCKIIADEMNPRYYESMKMEELKPAKKCDILVNGDKADYFVSELEKFGRLCAILEDDDTTFEEHKFPFS